MKRLLLITLCLCTLSWLYAKEQSETRGNYCVTLTKVSGHNAYLLTPTGVETSSSKRFPAVLVLHDHGAHFSIGKEKMVCPIWRNDLDSMTNAQILTDAQDWVNGCYHGMFVADSLSKAGFVVLVTDALYWGERGFGTDNRALKKAQETFYLNHLKETGEAWFETILREDKEAVTFLCSLPYVDTTQIFSFGFSMGAYRSWQLAAEDQRIAGCAAAHWMSTIRSTGGFITGVSSWSMFRPIPEGKQPLDVDYPLIAAKISPRPFLLLYGQYDHVLPAKPTKNAIRTIRQHYKSRQFQPVAFPVDHEFTQEHMDTLLTWLKTRTH